jgi:regulatory protein
MKGKDKPVLSKEEALDKLRYYCGYQERSRNQVSKKIALLYIGEDLHPYLFEKLEEEGFISEDRFKETFVRGKSRIKGWGPKKIALHLNHQMGEKVPIELVNELGDWKKAEEKLKRDMEKKHKTLKNASSKEVYEKLMRFGLSRGFDFEVVTRIFKEVMASE